MDVYEVDDEWGTLVTDETKGKADIKMIKCTEFSILMRHVYRWMGAMATAGIAFTKVTNLSAPDR